MVVWMVGVVLVVVTGEFDVIVAVVVVGVIVVVAVTVECAFVVVSEWIVAVTGAATFYSTIRFGTLVTC